MTQDLVSWVTDQIIEAGIDNDFGYLVLAALEGDAEFDGFLADGKPTREIRPSSDSGTAGSAREVGGTFLKSIEVEGFRGIGDKVTLDLIPEPGLTVIAGRNGSGKSSLAEALELVLTGSTYRWKNRTAPWKQHWRNLHQAKDAGITVTVTEEGVEKLTTIRSEWAADAKDVDDRTVWSQVHGQQRQGLEELGWSGPLETFRPLLSYDELGGLLVEGQAPLYDALATVLGVEQLTDALKRIGDRLKALKAPQAAATAERKTLQVQAAGLDDARAVEVAALLKKTAPDVDAIRAVVTGAAQVNTGPIAALRALAALTAPDTEHAETISGALRSAVQSMATAGEEASQRELDRIKLRKTALTVHKKHGDMPCPVCAGATLDAGWAETSAALVKKAEEELAGLTHAREELDRSRQAVLQLVAKRPAALDKAPLPELEDVVAAARAAWDAWATRPEGDLDLADHVVRESASLTIPIANVRAAATAAINELDDAWAPVAARIAGWCDTWTESQSTKPLVDQLAAAETWLKQVDARAKNERLVPIVDEARAAWTKLRQESNVELVGLELTGSKNQRRVAISATVDGEEASALPVMSQGELHALALALFLPRASMVDSPFRFLVIDDPVQAMDPAKVDGLAELLAELAKTRQVIVLSHDDRLPAAIRRSRVGAHLYEVRRGASSAVEIIKAEDPAQRYLADAFALIGDTELPSETVLRALPGLLRMAVESAARDRYFGQALNGGARLADVESAWSAAQQTAKRVSLAVHGEVKNLDAWLTKSYRKDGLGVVTSGFHGGISERSDLKDLTRCVERMVEDLRKGTK
ncbi:ABC-type lipoprotein export system ATPase subunit [Marmoricola sp. OAE513]|uniref:AAA family ATPase n=1 Tax=Marmoricola sp. OAE513 TaxID=2817894 RepID=UPI001AE12153